MQQLALDIALPAEPALESLCPLGGNTAVREQLRLGLEQLGDGGTAVIPVYLWGKSGAGKTHLLRALHRSLLERGENIGWMDASTGFPPEFNASWTAVLLDDIHLYTPMQQQRAFNWFVNASNPPSERPCWFVASGSSAPSRLDLREDLRSRLAWGYVLEVKAPDEHQCHYILLHEAARRGLALSSEVTQYMLRNFSQEISSLCQLLEYLDDFALRNKRPITVQLLKKMLATE